MSTLKPVIYKTPFQKAMEEAKLRKEALVALCINMTYLISGEYPNPKDIITEFTDNIAPRVEYLINSTKTADECVGNYQMLLHLNKCTTILMESYKESQKQGMLLGNVSPEQLEALSSLLNYSRNGIEWYKENHLRKQWLGELVDNAQASYQPSANMNNEWLVILSELFSADNFIDDVLLMIDELRAKNPDKSYKEAQILANIGTMLTNRNYSYQECDARPIVLSRIVFEAAKRLLPDNTCEKQVERLDRNISTLYFIPCLIETVASMLGKSQVPPENSLASFKETFAYEREDKQEIIKNSIRFFLPKFFDTLINLDGEEKLGKITEFVQQLAKPLDEVNPELSEWLFSLSSRVSIQEKRSTIRP